MKIAINSAGPLHIVIVLLFINVLSYSFGGAGGGLYAQNQILLDESWFIHAARDSNASNSIWDDITSTRPELRFEVSFQNDKIVVHGCCGGVFEMDVNYTGNNTLQILNLTETQTISCNDNYVTTFYQRIKGAFQGMIGETISYTIQQYNNGFGMALSSFILSHPSNNSFIDISNIPNEMNIDQSHAPFFGNNPPNHNWSLTHVEYEGEFLELPYGAAISTFNIYEGTFEIVLCGFINGYMNFSWIVDLKALQGRCFISCGMLENTTGVCEPVTGVNEIYLENFKQQVFDFLNDNLNQTMYYTFTFGPARKLIIEDLSQNKLIFHSNDNYLSTRDHLLDMEVLVYPNPTTEILFIKSPEIAGKISANIYSLNGKLLHHQSLNTSLTEVDVRHLNSGVYFIVFTNDAGLKQTLKFIKR